MDADILRAILKSYSDDENFVHLRISIIKYPRKFINAIQFDC